MFSAYLRRARLCLLFLILIYTGWNTTQGCPNLISISGKRLKVNLFSSDSDVGHFLFIYFFLTDKSSTLVLLTIVNSILRFEKVKLRLLFFFFNWRIILITFLLSIYMQQTTSEILALLKGLFPFVTLWSLDNDSFLSAL